MWLDTEDQTFVRFICQYSQIKKAFSFVFAALCCLALHIYMIVIWKKSRCPAMTLAWGSVIRIVEKHRDVLRDPQERFQHRRNAAPSKRRATNALNVPRSPPHPNHHTRTELRDRNQFFPNFRPSFYHRQIRRKIIWRHFLQMYQDRFVPWTWCIRPTGDVRSPTDSRSPITRMILSVPLRFSATMSCITLKADRVSPNMIMSLPEWSK